MSGRFISLEGGEGAGKSTQARALAAAIEARGLDVVATREPGGSPGAEAIRGLLMQGSVDRWQPRAEMLLFAAARADLVERTIRPALARGAWVICDRYIDSTRAYQGAAGGLSDEEIMAVHRVGSGGLLPDRTILLDMPIDTGRDRAAARDGAAADRFAARGEAFHNAVAAGFRRFAEAEPARFRVIDANGSPQVVGEAVLAAVADLLP
ncbi:dTMP kinase [Sphingomonas sp. GlSt437]|uniref:dTMP kinase n=1 Tax=Sphingomonas sp. GlSt437 TaxID=3389970 RepID=UPI003A84D82F